MGHESASESLSKNRFFNFISRPRPLAEMSDKRTEDRGALIRFGIDRAEVASEPVRRFKRRVSWGGIVTAWLKDGALLGSRSVTPLP